MTDPTPIRPPWVNGFWTGTPTSVLRELIESVDVFDTPGRALFLTTIRDEIDRRSADVQEA